MTTAGQSETGNVLRSLSLEDLAFIAKIARTPFQEWIVRHAPCVVAVERRDAVMVWRDETGCIQAWCKVCGHSAECGTGATSEEPLALVTIAVGILTDHRQRFTVDFLPTPEFDRCLRHIEQAILFCRLLEQAARSDVAH